VAETSAQGGFTAMMDGGTSAAVGSPNILNVCTGEIAGMAGSRLFPLSGRSCAALIGGLLGFCWFFLIFGPSVLNPTHLHWLMQGDPAQHVLGWLFFRNEPWSLPLGSVASFPYPMGTTVGFTDSIPWVAILAKLISPLLPVDFQYIGPWLGLCFFLQGFFGVRIVQELSTRPLIQILGGTFFILDPVLLGRIGHDSLCAHWLILGLMWLHLRPCPDEATQRRLTMMALGFCIVSAGIHPYLATMVLALSIALLCKLHWGDHLLSKCQLLRWGGIFGAVVLGAFTIFGYIGSEVSWEAGGFGFFAADVLTLINPMESSRLLPAMPSAPGQREGFGYVGSGVLFLSMIGMIIIWYHPRVVRELWKKTLIPLGICCVLFALFALSSKIRIGGKSILAIGTLYQPFMEIIAPFRSSGRFIWPLHYLLITSTVAIWIAYYRSFRLVLYIALSAAAIIQLMDTRVSFLRWYFEPHLRISSLIFQTEAWTLATGSYTHMVLYPPQILGGNTDDCLIREYKADYYVPLAFQAYRLKLTFNSGYFARVNEQQIPIYCEHLYRKITDGKFEDDTIYVVHPDYMDSFKQNAARISCGWLSDYNVCVSSHRYDAFREFLANHRIE
jgi:hypothetical protein